MTRKAALVALLDAQAPESTAGGGRTGTITSRSSGSSGSTSRRARRCWRSGAGPGTCSRALAPSRGVGIDISPKAVEIARSKYPGLTFLAGDAEDLPLSEPFDYIVLSDVIGYLDDVQRAFEQLNRVCHPRTRVILTYFNYLWAPVLRARGTARDEAAAAGPELARPGGPAEPPLPGRLSRRSRWGTRSSCPFASRCCLPSATGSWRTCPLLRKLCLVQIIVARPAPVPVPEESLSCSVVVPARNERGNIEDAVRRIPEMGTHTEIVFVEGNSSDGTAEEIERVIAAYPDAGREARPPGERRREGGRGPQGVRRRRRGTC